jgi:RNA polymerase sigma-70 factor, ECF subfamily
MRPPDPRSTGEPTFPAAARTWEADDDRLLVQRYRQGDRDAFTDLVVRYQRPVYSAAFWILKTSEDAHDVAQTVFLKAAERIDDYDPQYKFFSWIYRIAVNEALSLQRRRGHEEPLDDDAAQPAPDGDGPESQVSASQRAQRLRSAVMSLTASQRAVITLRHFQECSYEEVAEILGIEERTVKSRLFEARQRLRALLADLDGPPHACR